MSAYTPEDFEKMLLAMGPFNRSEQNLIDTVRDRDATIARLAAECLAWRTDPELSGYEGTATRTCVAATDAHPAARKAVEDAKP